MTTAKVTTFLNSKITGDLEEVPGVGPKTCGLMKAGEVDMFDVVAVVLI